MMNTAAVRPAADPTAGAKGPASMTRLRGLVIGNCQAHPLATALNIQIRDITFKSFGIHQIKAENRARRIPLLIEEWKESCDVILCQPLTDLFGGLRREAVADSFPKSAVRTISNLYFSGHHPDLTYLGGMGNRVVGPLGDYHSKIVTLAFCASLPPEAARRLFRKDVFQHLDHFSDLENSLKTLIARERQVDIPFAHTLGRLVADLPGFFTVNHPFGTTLQAYASEIAASLARDGLATPLIGEIPAQSVPNILANSVVYPVYPEIAEHHGLRISGSYVFRPGLQSAQPHPLTLEEFIEQEYAVLSKVDPEQLQASISFCDQQARFEEVAQGL